ncbi:MAG: FMN-binding protein [Candidatus Dadabacteria bacterium]
MIPSALNFLLLMRKIFIFVIFFALVAPPLSAIAGVFMKRDEALETAFPDADSIEKIEVYVSEDDARKIESLAKAKLNGRLFMVYKAIKGGETIGYAVIDTHELRSMTETVMFVINPDGTLKHTEILAFFEPPDYMPANNWIVLFDGKSTGDTLKVGRDIPNISGATITAVALSESVRRTLALIQVKILDSRASDGGAG